jgi:hypothetical protein
MSRLTDEGGMKRNLLFGIVSGTSSKSAIRILYERYDRIILKTNLQDISSGGLLSYFAFGSNDEHLSERC